MKNHLLTFLLIFGFTLICAQEDVTRVLVDDDTKSTAVVGKNENQFLVGSTAHIKSSICPTVSVNAYSKVDQLLWKWTPGFHSSNPQILFDTVDNTYLISMGTYFTDVIPQDAGTRIYRVDTNGLTVQSYLYELGRNYGNAAFDIHKENEILLAGGKNIKWFSINGDSLHEKNYDFFPNQIASYDSTRIFLRTNEDKLVQVNNRGEIQWEEDFQGDVLKTFQLFKGVLYTLHQNSIRSYIPSTGEWLINTYDTSQFIFNTISIDEGYTYIVGFDKISEFPVYLQLDLQNLTINNPLFFKQQYSSLKQVFHFKQKAILVGAKNFAKGTLYPDNSTINNFTHQTSINQEASFSQTDISISNILIDSIIYTDVDSLPNGNLVGYTDNHEFSFDITNHHTDTIHTFSIHSAKFVSYYCTTLGNFKRTYTGVNIPPGATESFRGRTHTGLIATIGSSLDFVFTAYAPNLQFDQNPNDNSISTTVDFDLTTNIENISLEEDIDIFPNPTTDIINVQTAGSIQSIEIFNISGQLVLHTIPLSNIWQGNLQNLPAGMYWVHIQTEDQTNWQKIIKQ